LNKIMIAKSIRYEQSGLQDWQKMLAESYTDPAELLADLKIPPDAREFNPAAFRLFPLRVPRSFVQRMKKGDRDDPLLRQVLPSADELIFTTGFSKNPLAEQKFASPGLLHKYSNRILIMVTGSCALNCRYCFRRYFPYRQKGCGAAQWQTALDYVSAHPSVNEVIFSGGDPLMAPDNQLSWLVDRIIRISHVKRLRIHTRLPVVIPKRITAELLNIFDKTRLQTLLVLHINHANEINDELAQSLRPLKRSGITLLNQAVLLKGVNDSVDILAELSEKLFEAGILPYYLHTLDRVQGAGHFLVPDESARKLMAGLLGRVAGYLVPRLTRETSGRDSKTPLDLYLE
jgi:EF-P beta-lysylation protein EpmB